MTLNLVTGASGFIGSHLARQLSERGQGVRCLVRRTSKTEQLEPLPVELVQGDVTALRMAAEVEPFFADPARRDRVAGELLDVRNALGEPGASGRVARMVLNTMGGVS